MMKKRKKVNRSKKGNLKESRLKYHLKHKSKLTSLLIIKVLLVLFSFGAGVLVYLFINNVMMPVLSAILAFAIACVLYLSLIVKVLKILKF